MKLSFLSRVSIVVAVALLSLSAFAGDSDLLESRLEELERLMEKSGQSMPKFHSLSLVKREAGPLPGIDALVYDAMVEQDGKTSPQRIVFFTDKKRRYLVMGSIIDTVKKKDVADDYIYRSLGEELSLGSLKRLPLLPGSGKRTVSVAVDLGQEGNRTFIEEIMKRRNSFVSGVEMALVSNARDEAAVGAQAIIAGSSGTDYMYESLAQWLKDGKKARFLDKSTLENDPVFKARLGNGIFHVDQNTTALMRAGIKRLPVVFVSENGKTQVRKPPSNDKEWCEVFECGSRPK